MVDIMTVKEFKKTVMVLLCESMSLDKLDDYCRGKTAEDKALWEEYRPILAVVNYKRIRDEEIIELGKKTKTWDAMIGGRDIYEVVQALPKNEHELRVGGQRSFHVDGKRHTCGFRGAIDGGFIPFIFHINDRFQFPTVIIEKIKAKHEKKYADNRSLIVAFSGNYAIPEGIDGNDSVISRWVDEIRRRTDRGTFREILLVDQEECKVFPVFADC